MKARAGPDGVHIFNRATGVNILLDEISVAESSWSRAPRQVSIALTNACDLKCPHCYAPKHAATLRADKIEGWLAELDNEGCLGIGFGGGEPTLHRDFARLCKFAMQQTGLAVTFTTHAHHIDDRLASTLAGNVNFVRVSMDGVGETYEMLRGKSFRDLRSRLKNVRALAPFGINFVVNRSTFGDIDKAIAVAAEMGASEFLLLPEQKTAHSNGIDKNTLHQLQSWTTSCRTPLQLAVSQVNACGFPTCDPLVKENGLRSYAHIDASGTLKQSSFDRAGVRIETSFFEALGLLQATNGRTQ